MYMQQVVIIFSLNVHLNAIIIFLLKDLDTCVNLRRPACTSISNKIIFFLPTFLITSIQS